MSKTSAAASGSRDLLNLKMKPSQDKIVTHPATATTWINKDKPKDVSTLAPYKDGYEDILNERRQDWDFGFMTRTRKDVPVYKHHVPRGLSDIKQHVLGSDRVKYTIERLIGEKKASKEELTKEAESILDEMAHSLSMKAVRGFAFFLIKIFKQLFRRVYVNKEGVQTLRKLMHEYPVLLMPTHRSYMDFLLLSYICYHYDLPLPAIAAAMDFKGMKFFGWLLRHCGAFYIRRSFGTDWLYWAVFTEYVQTHLRNADAPLEFFVEGTRSRTNKSYIPKSGMLAASLESYFKAELPDTMMVPVTITYDRIVEESLYAYELLGIPKPKESTSGLLKARSVLNDDFGCVHLFIGEPISIREFSNNKIDRVLHSLEPRYINSVNKSEMKLINDLAFHIVKQQQRHMVISPWSLMAAVLMQNREGISIRQLAKEADWLKRQAYNLGAYVDWPGDLQSEDVIRRNLALHSNILTVSDQDRIELKLVRPAHVAKPVKDDILLNAATNLILASYRNQVTHVFVNVALVALSVNSCRDEILSIHELQRKYTLLERLLSKDFVFQPGHTKQDFDQAVLFLKHSGALVLMDDPQMGTGVLEDDRNGAGDNQVVLVKKSFNKHTTFYSLMFEPFLLAYWVVCQHLLSLPVDVHGRPLPKRPKDLTKDVQKLAIRLLEENAVKHYEILSLDLISNGLLMLMDFGTMYKDKRNNETWLSPNNVAVSTIADEIASYIELPSIPISNFISSSRPLLLQAKL